MFILVNKCVVLYFPYIIATPKQVDVSFKIKYEKLYFTSVIMKRDTRNLEAVVDMRCVWNQMHQ